MMNIRQVNLQHAFKLIGAKSHFEEEGNTRQGKAQAHGTSACTDLLLPLSGIPAEELRQGTNVIGWLDYRLCWRWVEPRSFVLRKSPVA